MSKKDEFNYVPEGLPEPKDDGACDHLLGLDLPSVGLKSTSGKAVDLSKVGSEYLVIFCYPMTGSPLNKTLLEHAEEWDAIPGACGCTPQACNYRDSIDSFRELGAEVFGVASSDPEYQKEARDRLELDYELLSDERLEFADELRLPTFEFYGMELIKRVTLIVKDNKIVQVYYPIFPPNSDSVKVLDWLKRRRGN